jgi:hypothetical protein
MFGMALSSTVGDDREGLNIVREHPKDSLIMTDDINGIAKLNLCEKCYPVYKGMIEPSIRAMTEQFFHDWSSVEALVFGMVLKHGGAIKKQTEFFLQIEDKDLDKFADHIDIEKYKELKHEYGHFKDQLKYLVDNEVIGPKLRDYVTLVAKRRHKIHSYKGSISDPERAQFALANMLLEHIKSGMTRPDLTAYHRKRQVEKMDQAAKAYLGYLKII